MLNSLTLHNNHVPQQHAQDAELLKESGVHKLVVADRDGNCLAFVLAWDSFDYDAETDTLCVRCQQRWQRTHDRVQRR